MKLYEDIRSREKIAEEGAKKADIEETKSVSKGNKRRKAKGNKEDVPLLPDEIGVHDDARIASDVPSDDEGVKQDK